jgi:hypothetical protein
LTNRVWKTNSMGDNMVWDQRVAGSNPATPIPSRTDTLTVTHVTEGDAARFWGKVAVAEKDDCWLWTGAVSKNGYGSFKLGRQATSAHRVAFHIGKGAWPEGRLLVRHKCDTPLCCNPHHLEAGTHVDNGRDMMERGRWAGGPSRGEHNGNAKLNCKAVANIREQISQGRTNIAIGKAFGVTHSMISRIRRGKSWSKS